MNPNIENQKKLKKKLGVTITKNMGLKDLVQVLSKVPDEVIPGIGGILTTVNMALEIQQGLRAANEVSTIAYHGAQDTLEDATSAVYTGGVATQMKGSMELAKAAELSQNVALEVVREQTFDTVINSV
ncbi:MAG: hypothetical protein WDA59_09070 [Methanofastidiosum sp.]|jgi:hypothetical protein|nr:hypothetical protein [Tenuifilaceae bacterium]